MNLARTRLGRTLAAVLVSALLLGHLPLLMSGVCAQMMLTLREGRELEVELIDDARSGSVKAGGQVRFRVSEDIEVHGEIAIPAGHEGLLLVEEVEKNGMFGKPGEVVFGEGRIPVGNANVLVSLKGASGYQGKSKKTMAVLLTLVLVGPFIKGGQGGLAVGERILVEIAETRQVTPGS